MRSMRTVTASVMTTIDLSSRRGPGTWAFSSVATLALCLWLPLSSSAQGHLAGEFIVMFHQEQDASKIASSHGLEWVEALSPRANIHLMQLPSPGTPAQDWAVLRALQDDRRLKAAQFNHEVQPRETLPNDPSLGQQWHHVESGDHDIDSDLAWDITTGGAASNGSRIVVAVLEGGGSNYNHVDLIDNHWVNDAEIPGNGVDDDLNGFVDDYNGWNSGTNTDAIGAGGHGTSVSGMIGATGDNGNGGVGVNWDVEIMQVDMGNGLSEATVIAAYNYPFEMRALYNASEGARGAFVVATNASWGIDLADPANYPVWCAYYDDLGAQGILNCGATANQQYNIDTQGDMPTGCSSPYMVAVTATDDNDVRTFSGYGATTIDLGAPGDAVYLPSGSTGYGNTSGTSFASPCVAGAIALVYSAPCPDLMELALSNPQAAADLVRGYILDGTDEVPNLIGETVTGGRLNVHNALSLALANCGPLECAPDSIYATTGCVYNPSLDSVVTEINLGVELSSFLCSTSEVCLSAMSDSSEAACDSIALAPGDIYTFSGLMPSVTYELSYTVDSLSSDAVLIQTLACDTLVPGCNAPSANNFDPSATIDDGSCDFPCIDFTLSFLTDCWPQESGWNLVSADTVVAQVSTGEYTEEQNEYLFEQCLTEGCYELTITDSFGDGLAGTEWTDPCEIDGDYFATDSSGAVLFQMGVANFGEQVSHSFCLPAVVGCTNEEACNFNPEANTDNGTCEVPGSPCDDGDDMTINDVIGDDCMCSGEPAVAGCTDEEACNYDEAANVDDDSCYFLGSGQIAGPLFPTAGDTVTYAYNGAQGTNFQWEVVGGEVLEGQGTTEVLVVWGSQAGSGALYVTESDDTGCASEVVRTVTILATTDVVEQMQVALSLMPNPARESFRIEFTDQPSGLATVTIFDARGAEVRQSMTEGLVSLSGMSAGRYTVRIATARGISMLPLVIQ